MRTVTLLQINDTHGYLEEHQELFGDDHRVVGGYARIKSYFDSVRTERGADSVITLDNGDTLHGTFPAVHTAGQALIAPLNELGIDAWTVHWDIMYGPHRLEELAGQLNYPLLAANCHREDAGPDPFPGSILLERAGVRVGIVGLAATIIDKMFPARASEGLRFTIGEDELKKEIRQLKDKGAELIVVLSHLGFPQDCKLAQRVPGIDVIVSGHTHNRMDRPFTVGETTIFQSGCHGSFVGRLDIDVDQDDSVGDIRHELVEMGPQISPDPGMQKMVNDIYSPHRQALRQVVGRTATDLDRYTMLESTMDNFLLDAVSSAAGTEICFSNGWRYGAPIPAGPITREDLWNIIPTNPYVETVQMTGAELWEMMEQNLEHTFAADPYGQMGGYVKRCRGVQIRFKAENPAGARIQEFYAEGDPLEEGRLYTVGFVTQQGVPARFDRNRTSTMIRAVEALESYLDTHSPVSAELRGTVIAV